MLQIKPMRFTTIAFIGTILSASAFGQVSGLYNTGVDNSGTVLSNLSTDTHYNFSFANGPQTAGIAVTDAEGDPVGVTWLSDDARSDWDTVSDSTSGPAGDYLWTTTFNISSLASPINLVGRYSSDDVLEDVLVNGHSTGISSTTVGNWPFWFNLDILSAKDPFFQTGTNTLQFVVSNSAGPTGLRVEFGVPDSGLNLAWVAAALGGLCLIGRSARRSVAA